MVPGTIEAEDYDTGGQGIAYNDTDRGQQRPSIPHGRRGHLVFEQSSRRVLYRWPTPPANGWRTRWMWPPPASTSSTCGWPRPTAGGRCGWGLTASDVTGPINLPNTGSWSVWQTVSTTANLTAGQHVLRIEFVVGGLNFNWINIDQAGALNISDDFDDGNTNGWTPVSDSGNAPQWRVVNRNYQQLNFVGHKGTALDGGYHLGTYAYLSSWPGSSNYRFSVKAIPFAESGQEIGVMFHYQNNDNYYRVSFSYSDGFSRLEKKVGGVFTTLAQNARAIPTGTPFKIICEINNGIIQVSVATDAPNFLNEEKLFSAYDTSLSSGTVALYSRDGSSFDDVEIRSPGTATSVSISSPADYSVFPTATFDVSAVVMNQPTNGAVDFSLDGNTARCTGETEVSPGVWQAQCTAASAGFHSLTAVSQCGGP